MTLTQLRYYQTVCKYSNISKASQSLNVSQPAVSIAIANLESELGVVLFQRENRLLEITEAGRLLLSLTNDLLENADAIYRQMEKLKSNQTLFRIGIVPFSFTKMFHPILYKFQAAFPEVDVQVFECSAQSAIQKIKTGQLDVALTVDLEDSVSYVDGLRLYSTPSILAVSKTHPFAGRTECSLSDLATQSLILAKEDSYLSLKIKERFRQLGISPRNILYTSQANLISSMLSSGTYSSIISRNLAEDIPNIVQIPIRDSFSVTSLLLWKRVTHLPPATAKFISLVKLRYSDAKPY